MTQICAIQTNEDHDILQQDLDNLVNWSHNWQLGFNETKCKSLHLGSSIKRLEYRIETETLGEGFGFCFIDEELKFHAHVSSAVKKA